MTAYRALVRWFSELVVGREECPQIAAADLKLHRLHFLASRLGHPELPLLCHGNHALNQMRFQAASEIAAAMARRGIRCAFIKGIYLAPVLYSESSDRAMGDIDVLVRDADIDGASQVLRRLGYRQMTRGRFHHARDFCRGKMFVDLHRHLIQPLRCRVGGDALWRGSVEARMGGAPVVELAPEVHALIQLVVLMRAELVAPLGNYLDASRLLTRLSPGAGETLDDMARRFGLRRGVGAALKVVESLNAGQVPSVNLLFSLGPSEHELANLIVGRQRRGLLRLLLTDNPALAVRTAVASAASRLDRRDVTA